jgi:branched-subunit amino acid ABC-type transport system permease component
MVAVALGAALAGIGGVLLGLDTSIDPLTGYRILLSVFAAAVLGGLGSVPGAVVGALSIGIAEELALLVVPATYRSAIGFFAILLMLTFRPRGLVGERAV